jgi:hypothetical protein
VRLVALVERKGSVVRMLRRSEPDSWKVRVEEDVSHPENQLHYEECHR